MSSERQLQTPVQQATANRLSFIHQAALRSSAGPLLSAGQHRHSKLSPFEASQMSGVSISMVERAKIDGEQFLSELLWLRRECSKRCLLDAELWANELLAYCPEKFYPSNNFMNTELYMNATVSSAGDVSFVDCEEKAIKFRNEQSAQFAMTLMKNREFLRASFFLEKARADNPLYLFLYYRCLFLAYYQDNLESDAEGIERRTSFGEEKAKFSHLYDLMNAANLREHDDVFFEYLLALIEVELGLKEQAYKSLAHVVKREPRMWPAWEGMVRLVADIETADQVVVAFNDQSLWMADWFMVLVLERFHQDTMAIQKAETLVSRGMTAIPMIIAKIAVCSNHRHDHDQAIANFEDIRKMDPYRLTDLNLLSDSLYIRGDQQKLSQLALEVYKVHKFRWETCCIVGNYHAIRRDSEHSIKFFQRALRLNPGIASLWVLIGHEFMEMKNNAAACVSYRRAIEIDRVDYRGWYGLGQMYDIMKMPAYSLFYYQQAQKCKPHDSRLLVALGDIYSKLNRFEDAEKCFTGAYLFGDVEGSALWNLAKLHENCQDEEKAVKTFEVYLVVYDRLTNLEENIVYAIAYLANYYFKQKMITKATEYATRCLEYEAICQEGNRLFREIAKVQAGQSAMERELDTSDPPNDTVENRAAEDDMAVSDGENEDVSF